MDKWINEGMNEKDNKENYSSKNPCVKEKEELLCSKIYVAAFVYALILLPLN